MEEVIMPTKQIFFYHTEFLTFSWILSWLGLEQIPLCKHFDDLFK